MLFFDRGAVGRIGNDDGFAQMLGGLTGIDEQFAFHLLQTGPEKLELRLIHVVCLRHSGQLCLGQRLQCFGHSHIDVLYDSSRTAGAVRRGTVVIPG